MTKIEDYFLERKPGTNVWQLQLSVHDCWVDTVKLQSCFGQTSFSDLFGSYSSHEEWNEKLIAMGHKNVSDLFLAHGLVRVSQPTIGCVSWFQEGQLSDFFNVKRATYAAFFDGEKWIKRGSRTYTSVSDREKKLIETINGMYSFEEVNN